MSNPVNSSTSSSNPRGRNWVFTLNNYTQEEHDFIFGIRAQSETGATGSVVRYLVVGREIGASGTPHLQGYIELLAAKYRSGVKAILGTKNVHLEPRKGTQLQAAEYCKKEKDFYETGISPRGKGTGDQGRRSDLEEVAEVIRNGASARQVFETQPAAFIRYHRGISAAIGLFSEQRSSPTQVIWRYGPTGTGKSRDTFREAEELYSGRVVQLGDLSGRWFDGVTACSRAAIFDEFDGTMPISLLLRLLDRYPCQVPVKGGMVQWCVKLVFITSQFSPEHYYADSGQWDALVRRLSGKNGVVLRYTVLGNLPVEHDFNEN